MKYLVLLLTLLTACQCGSTHKRVAVMHSPALVTWAFHGDTDFTLPERRMIAEAIHDIEYQTAGFYRLSVVYDLNFHDKPELQMGQPWLVRADSSYPWIQLIEFDRGRPQPNGTSLVPQILGLTMRSDDPQKSPECYLVVDRLEDSDMFHHVAMHELLHAAGLADLGPPNSVMSGAAYLPPRLCMSPADQAEFCRVLHCAVTELNGCDW